MKRLGILLGVFVILLTSTALGQEEEKQKNEIYIVDFLKPQIDKIQVFEDALKEHNNKYHSDYPVFVSYHMTGKFAGYYGVVMGPHTWTEWEARETSQDHDKHWLEEVLPLCEKISEPQYWRRIPKFELNPIEGEIEKSIVTVLSIKPGEFARFWRTLEDWHETNKESEDYTNNYNVYTRWFDNPDQIAIVGGLKNGLADFDEQGNFRSRYEDQHGKQSWDVWFDDSIMSIESIDETLRMHRPELGTQME
ncbi:hypothetical protein [Fodinibius saliphilus]|uniref:hypothetical protein n=1 Tax=Fodinibius saliphilus TaxID=1920650 RepID=UPI00110894CF|nr:hypothetical protein [Fodinibius saliphilus]